MATEPNGVAEVTAALDKARLDAAPDAASSDDEPATGNAAAKKKKKKPKKKKKADYWENGGGVPVPREVAPESEADKTRWEAELKPTGLTQRLDAWFILQERERPKLKLFRTPGCVGVGLRTPRLVLRQVEVGDTTAIRRIKMEPVVQRTQLYGSPSASDIKDSFQRRYVASSVPRLEPANAWRDEYIFAITAKEGSGIKVAPAGQVKISNRISSAEGYLGNFALSLECEPTEGMKPRPGIAWVHPPASVRAEAGLVGKMFYEIHPQLWGQGIVSEAFAEVLRFAIEEVGCVAVVADPTEGNDASVRLCTKNGMVFTHESADNAFGKAQLFHRITRQQWFVKNKGGSESDAWGGKEACRWCCDFRLGEPKFVCEGCGWAKYCSRECQRADWLWRGGHQAECGKEAKH